MHGLHADEQQDGRPGGETQLEQVEEARPHPVVRAAATEDIGAVDGELERPDEQQREGDGRHREAEDVPGAPERADAPQAAGAEVERAADDEIAGEGDDPAGDDSPDGDVQDVVLGVVVERACGARGEGGRDPGEQP